MTILGLCMIGVVIILKLTVTTWALLLHLEQGTFLLNTNLILICMTIMLLCTIFKGKYKLLSEIISIVILYISVLLIIQIIFKLEGHTLLIYFEIVHTIPLEWKILYYTVGLGKSMVSNFGLDADKLLPIVKLALLLENPSMEIMNAEEMDTSILHVIKLTKYIHFGGLFTFITLMVWLSQIMF